MNKTEKNRIESALEFIDSANNYFDSGRVAAGRDRINQAENTLVLILNGKKSPAVQGNKEHQRLFMIPVPQNIDIPLTQKELPVQKVITGDQQTDAYLWIVEVIKTNDPFYLSIAEEALSKLTITPKQAQENYSAYLSRNGAHALQIAFGSIGLDNPHELIEAAKLANIKAMEVLRVFGSFEAALEYTPAERLMRAEEIIALYEHGCLTEEELAEGVVRGQRVWEIDEQRREASQGFKDLLPDPETLSDVIHELEYWNWLYRARSIALKELYNDYPPDDYMISDREDYLAKKLEIIKPVDRKEAKQVLEWILENERFNEDNDNILLNLI